MDRVLEVVVRLFVGSIAGVIVYFGLNFWDVPDVISITLAIVAFSIMVIFGSKAYGLLRDLYDHIL